MESFLRNIFMMALLTNDTISYMFLNHSQQIVPHVQTKSFGSEVHGYLFLKLIK